MHLEKRPAEGASTLVRVLYVIDVTSLNESIGWQPVLASLYVLPRRVRTLGEKISARMR